MQFGKKPLPETIPDAISAEEGMRAEICECGGVHLHVGPMSLRFSFESFTRFFRFLTAVNKRLEERHGSPSTTTAATTTVPVIAN